MQSGIDLFESVFGGKGWKLIALQHAKKFNNEDTDGTICNEYVDCQVSVV